MSYILDALKKADQKRKVGMIPGLQTDHAALVNIEKRRRFLPILVVLVAAVLFLNGVLWLWWSRPWQDDSERQATLGVVAPVSQPQPVLPRTRESVRPPALPSQNEAPRVVENMNVPPQVNAPPAQVPVTGGRAQVAPPIAAPAGPVAHEEVEAPVLTYPEEPLAQIVAPDEQGGEAEEAAAAAPVGDQSAGVVAQADLPEHIQQALPQIRISLHFFSNKPEARLVRINDRHLHEGDMVASDLRLLEITEGGVILGFRGYQFRLDKL